MMLFLSTAYFNAREEIHPVLDCLSWLCDLLRVVGSFFKAIGQAGLDMLLDEVQQDTILGIFRGFANDINQHQEAWIRENMPHQ